MAKLRYRTLRENVVDEIRMKILNREYEGRGKAPCAGDEVPSLRTQGTGDGSDRRPSPQRSGDPGPAAGKGGGHLL